MTLLFDQNISFRIIKKIEIFFPGAKQIREISLENATDSEIWKYAKKNDCCIVTFDSDFIDLSALNGFPPKIIWLRTGNTSTDNIAKKLMDEHLKIIEFLNDKESAFFELQ